jgi:hypothetical protein
LRSTFLPQASLEARQRRNLFAFLCCPLRPGADGRYSHLFTHSRVWRARAGEEDSRMIAGDFSLFGHFF